MNLDLLLAGAAAVDVLHQALLADGVNLAVADKLREGLAQLVGKLAALDADRRELISADRLGDIVAVQAFLVRAQGRKNRGFQRRLLAFIEARALLRFLATTGLGGTRSVAQDGIRKVENTERCNCRP